MITKTALLLIDIQNDYFPDGRMELAGAEAAGQRAAEVLRCCRELQLPVVHIAHESVREGATFFLPGTEGQKIHRLVQPSEGETVLIKHFPNSFRETGLAEFLHQQGIADLLVAGMMTHMCVDATVRAAKDLGLTCTLIHDATATRTLAFGESEAPAAFVQTAFIAALASICDGVKNAAEMVRLLKEQAGFTG